MRIRIPSKKACERFLLIYELEGCQKAVNYLTRYYGIRKMKIMVNGRRTEKTRTGKPYIACYYKNKAYFQKREVNKRNVLHELYHHIVEVYGLDMKLSDEDREANRFAREVLIRART